MAVACLEVGAGCRGLEGDEGGEVDTLTLPQVHAAIVGQCHAVYLQQHIPLAQHLPASQVSQSNTQPVPLAQHMPAGPCTFI